MMKTSFTFYWGCIISILIVMACNPSKKALNTAAKEDTSVGYFKMGLIDSYIADSIQSDENMKMFATNMIGMFKAVSEYEVVYNDSVSVELVNTIDSTGKKIRSYYSKSTNELLKFTEYDGIKYINVTDLNETPDTVDENELSSVMEVIKFKDGGKTILNFDCDHIKLKSPADSMSVFAEFYTTNKVPFFTSSAGILGESLDGMPLLGTVYLGGVNVTTGALSHKYDKSYEKYLQKIDRSEFEELDMEKFDQIIKAAEIERLLER